MRIRSYSTWSSKRKGTQVPYKDFGDPGCVHAFNDFAAKFDASMDDAKNPNPENSLAHGRFRVYKNDLSTFDTLGGGLGHEYCM